MFSKLIERFRSLQLGVGAVALVAVNLLLLAGLLTIIIRGTQADAILATPGKTLTATPIDIEVPVLAANLEVIQAQPIFHTSRSFYVPPDPATLAVHIAPPDYRVVGSMSLPNKQSIVFLVHNQSGARTKVKKGDVLDGWSVEEVTAQRVALSLDGHQAEISAAKSSGAPGLQAVTMTTPPPSAQGGLRILSAGSAAPGSTQGFSRAGANSNLGQLPKAPPGSVGARLYRPPPGQ